MMLQVIKVHPKVKVKVKAKIKVKWKFQTKLLFLLGQQLMYL